MKITDADFIRAMREAVDERGEGFVYPKGEAGWVDPNWESSDECVYVRQDVDEPACIIGTALHKAGVSLEFLRAHEGDAGRLVLDHLRLSHEVIEAGNHAQMWQDEGQTWGEALAEFNRKLESVPV